MPWEAISAIVGAIVGPFISVSLLGWWLRGQFADAKDSAALNLAEHEQRDQARHEDNLQRFGVLNVALARLGYKNGP